MVKLIFDPSTGLREEPGEGVFFNDSAYFVGTSLGQISRNVLHITGTYVVDESIKKTFLFIDATAAEVGITLPDATTVPYRTYSFLKIDTSGNAAVFSGSAGQLIDGVATNSLANAYDHVEIIASGSAWYTLTGGGAGSDTTAIHNNVGGEISAVATKTTPTISDYLLIEDAAASDAKKRITIGDLPGSVDVAAHYITMAATSSLPNERVLTAGTGIVVTDGGAGNAATIDVNDSVVATVSGTAFSSTISATIISASVEFQGNGASLSIPHFVVPSQTSVTGVTETLIGSVYLVVTSYDISAFLGEETAAYNGILRFRLSTDSTILTTLTATTAQPANVSTTGVSVSTEGWYEMFLYSDNAAGVAICEGIMMTRS